MNNIISIPLGIVDVIWNYDNYDEIRTAFYQLIIMKKDNEFEFENNYYFLKNNLFLNKEYTSTNVFNIIILEIDNNKLKVQICGDILYLTKEQYNLLNEKITKYNDKYNFNFSIVNSINKKSNY